MMSDNLPAVFEIGVFFFRAQGVGFNASVYKTYIDGVVNDNSTDIIQIIDDPTNGVGSGDGRVHVYDYGAQTQAVFTNRNATIGGTGYRISSSADTADASAAGGISVKQPGPLTAPPGTFHEGNGELGYRFNLTVANLFTGSRYFAITTPTPRINSFSTYNSLDSNTSTEFKVSTVVDGLVLTSTWNPAPSTIALLAEDVPPVVET